MKSTAEAQTRTSKKTWWMCWFLFLGTALIYLDRTILALTAEKIIHDFELSSEGLGHVIGAFRSSYGIFQILGGFLVDAYRGQDSLPCCLRPLVAGRAPDRSGEHGNHADGVPDDAGRWRGL